MNQTLIENGTCDYRITAMDEIEYVNDAWARSAEDNHMPDLPYEVLGTSLWQYVMGKEVVQLSQQLFVKIREKGSEVTIPFRGDSPSLRRFMGMKIIPKAEGNLEFCTWVEREEPYDQPILLLDPSVKKDQWTQLSMCSWCKKIRVDHDWLEIEDAIEKLRLFHLLRLPGLSHGICEPCMRMLVEL